MEGNDNQKPITEITRQDIEGYLEWCYYKGNGNQTRYTKLTALSKYFRYLKYENIIPEDITLNIPKPVIHNRRMQTFMKEDILNFFRAVDITTEKGLRDVAVFILAVFCGLRIGEICGLKLNDIIDDGKDIDIAIPESLGKKHASRTIYLWKAPAMFIRQYILIRLNHGAGSESPFLITYKNKRPSQNFLSACDVNNLIKAYAAKAAIRKTKLTCHMFRATHANDLQHIEGYTLPAIQDRMGWKDLSTAGRYLIRRERIHRTYKSLHAYWIEFAQIWDKRGKDADSNNEQSAANGEVTGSDEQGGSIDGKP